MAEVMNSLFGITPESLMAQREAALQAQAMRYAEMDPFQRATAGIYAGANKLGGAVGGMLGAQDPEMMRITQRQQLVQQAQPQDAAGWQALAQQFYNAGDTPAAQEAMAKAQSLQSVAIKQGLDTSTMASNLATAAGRQFDVSPEGRAQELAKSAKYTSESISDFIEGKGQLVAIDKFAKPQPDFIAKAVELKFGDKPTYGAYSPEQAAKVNAALLAEDLKKKATGASKTTVTVDAKGETEFVKELGKLDAKKVSEAATASTAAIDQLTTLKKMSEVAQRPVISGSLAEQRTDVSNFFNTIGLSSSADKVKTANSQEFIKYSTGLVLDNLKKTGYNPSNADMKVVQALIPRLETDPLARTELIKFMAEKANMVVNESARLDQYARANKGLSGYKPSIPQINFGGGASTSQYSTLSDAELEARIRAARGSNR
jgi:hypothetical protein